MFAAIKSVKGTSVRQFRGSVEIRKEKGVVVTNEKDKTAVFTRYFEGSCNPPTKADRELLREYEVQHERGVQPDQVSISETEVEGALKAVQNRKAEGISGIHPEVLKYGGADMI